jgi:hypothetical protein
LKEKEPVFGSVRTRFDKKKTVLQPGPGSYSIEISNQKPKSSSELKEKMQKLFKKVKNGNINSNNTGLSGFGTQADRFGKIDNADMPPPGAYEISKAFENVRNRGRLENSALASMTGRVLFKSNLFITIVMDKRPGPGEYNNYLPPKDNRTISSFLSNVHSILNK